MILTLVILAIVIVIILITPIVVKAKINSALKNIDGYVGHIDSLNINLFASKIKLGNLMLRKSLSEETETPLLNVPTVSIDFQWNSLFKKILDLNILIEKPRVHFVADPPKLNMAEENKGPKEIPSIKNSIENLIGFKVNIEIVEAEIQYLNPYSNPPLNATVDKFNLKITDFSNRLELSETSRIGCVFQVYEGTGEVNVILRPLAQNLTFFLDLRLKFINLVLLNDLFLEYGKVDLNSGTLDIFAEVAVKENSFKGYVKPLFTNLDFISRSDKADSIFKKVWERTLAVIFSFLANKHDDQVATIIPIEGRLDDPKVRVSAAIMGVLRNAFIQSMTPSFEKIINFKTVMEYVKSGIKALIHNISLLKF